MARRLFIIYLNSLDEVFIPDRKECRFFSDMPGNFIGGPAADYQNDTIQSIEDYKILFNGAENIPLKGDISNDYFYYYNQSIANIKKILKS